MNDRSKMSRRELIRKAGIGSFGSVLLARELGAFPSLESYVYRISTTNPLMDLDSRFRIANAMQGGIPLLRWLEAQRACAQSGVAPWSVVHIKVVNHVATQLLFRLGKPDFSTGLVENGSDIPNQELNGLNISPSIFSNMAIPAVKESLARSGLGKLSMLSLGLSGADSGETYGRRYRMNEWFAQILHNPSAAQESNFYGSGFLSGSGVFDHSAVGLSVALGLEQTRGGNHSLKNFKLRREMPDLTFYLQDRGIIQSPLGISAFMMGDEYDAAEGLLKQNAVLSAYADEENAAVNGVAVQKHVESLVQSIQLSESGYISNRSENSLLTQFDKLVQSDPVLRREMEKAKSPLKLLADDLASVAALERTSIIPNFQDAMVKASVQATGLGGSPPSNGTAADSVGPARGEFLAQVHYAAKLLAVEGRPVRNFSLFLNMTDCDGNAVDTAAYGAPSGAKVQCLSYVEGMRQLAIGLNILSQVIKKSGNVIVVVNSEGGRANTMGDSSVGFSIVMGPRNTVSSSLIANMNSVDDGRSAQSTNPGAVGSSHVFSSSQLFDSSGRGSNGNANVGDFQVGVIRSIADKVGSDVDLSELGNFLKIG